MLPVIVDITTHDETVARFHHGFNNGTVLVILEVESPGGTKSDSHDDTVVVSNFGIAVIGDVVVTVAVVVNKSTVKRMLSLVSNSVS